MKIKSKKENRYSFFEQIFEVLGWIRIVISPTLIGVLLACFVYYPNPSDLTFGIASVIIVLGLIIGIIWANRVWKKHGTQFFLSRISATPDLDQKKEEKKDLHT